VKLWNVAITWERPQGSDERELGRLYRKLRRLGVSRGAAASTIADLRGDLAEAGSLAALTGGDINAFAADVARANGRAPVRGHHLWITIAMAIPMLTVAFITYVFVAGGGPALGLDYHAVELTEKETVRFEDGSGRTTEVESSLDELLPLFAFFVSTVLGVGGGFGLAAAALALLGDSRIGATLLRCLVTLPLGGVAGIAAAVAFGASTDYSDAPAVIAAEVLLVCLFGASSIVVAREWARRLPQEVQESLPPPALLAHR
jgi:hypothetical protein